MAQYRGTNSIPVHVQPDAFGTVTLFCRARSSCDTVLVPHLLAQLRDPTQGAVFALPALGPHLWLPYRCLWFLEVCCSVQGQVPGRRQKVLCNHGKCYGGRFLFRVFVDFSVEIILLLPTFWGIIFLVRGNGEICKKIRINLKIVYK